MRKIVVAIVVMALCISAAFADGITFGGGLFTFEPQVQTPLYAESASDPYGFTSRYHKVVNLSEATALANVYSIVVDYSDEENPVASYKKLRYGADDEGYNSMYEYVKAAASVSLCRFTFEGWKWIPQLEAEVEVAAAIDSMFESFNKNLALGFDGYYFIGGSLRVDGKYTIRAGVKHVSGHYSDEILEKMYAYQEVDFGDTETCWPDPDWGKSGAQIADSDEYLNGVVEYVRDNSFAIAVAADILDGLHIYAEAALPLDTGWTRPVAHMPAFDNPYSQLFGDTFIERIGSYNTDAEGLPQDQLDEEYEAKLPTGYLAWDIHAGIEYRYSFKYFTVFASTDVQLHQDGQTLHQLNSYDSSNPWEYEWTIGGGIELLNTRLFGMGFRIDAYYHTGRAPLAQYFYQRMDYISIGMSIV